MKILTSLLFVVMIFGWGGLFGQKKQKKNKKNMDVNGIYDFSMKSIDGKDVSLSEYEGKVVLIVNVASKCGLTPQYKELQALYEEYSSKGLVILGFPANDFLWQEPGTDAEIQSFCSLNYGVSFPMFSKITVKGKKIHPLYSYLTETTETKVSWNFQKFLVGKDGKVIQAFSPKVNPKAQEIIDALEKVL